MLVNCASSFASWRKSWWSIYSLAVITHGTAATARKRFVSSLHKQLVLSSIPLYPALRYIVFLLLFADSWLFFRLYCTTFFTLLSSSRSSSLREYKSGNARWWRGGHHNMNNNNINGRMLFEHQWRCRIKSMCQTRFFLLLYGENIRNFWRRSILYGCRQHAMYSEFHFACWGTSTLHFNLFLLPVFQIFTIFNLSIFWVRGGGRLRDDRLKMCAAGTIYWGMLNGCVTMETCNCRVVLSFFFFFFFF